LDNDQTTGSYVGSDGQTYYPTGDAGKFTTTKPDADTEKAVPQADSANIKVTAYGYPGDSTPDTKSSEGIGDRDNKIESVADHQSVALTVPERERIFGTGGKSTGQSFSYNGKTYWDEDTAPEGDYRIDVYSPNHPPDKFSLSSGYRHPTTNEVVWEPPKEEDYQKPTQTADSYSEPEEKPNRVGKADDSILAPQNMVKALRQQYPMYQKVPDQKLYEQFKAKYPTGLSQLRAAFPQYKKIANDKFLKAIKEKYFQDDTDDEFTDRINPPSGFQGVYHSIAEQAPRIVSGFYQGSSELGRFPERAQNALNQAVIALGINQKPQLTKEQEMVQNRLEALGYKQSGQLTPVAKGLLSGIVDPGTAQQLTVWAQKQAAAGKKYEQQARIPKPHDFVGQAAAKGFEGLGGFPAIAPAFMGGESIPALALGMVYDAVQGEGKAREKGLDNSLMFGAEGMSYRALQQWFMYTPRGRALSALLWAGGGMADQEAQALLADPKGEINRAFSQPVNTAADLLSTAAVNAFFGGLVSMGVDKLKPDAAAAFEEARMARESGDYKTAAQLLDKTMLLLPDIPRKVATNNLLAWRNEAIEARPGDQPLEMPGQRGFMVLKGKMSEEPFLEPKGTEVRPQEEQSLAQPPEAPTGKISGADYKPGWNQENLPPEDQARYKAHGENIKQAYSGSTGPDGATDQFYYSGIDIGKAYEDLAKAIKPVRELFAPEHETSAREASGAVIGEQIGKMQRENQRMAQSWYRKQQLEDTLRFAYEADHRRAFWESIPKGTSMRMFEQHESGQSTGNRVADRMFQLHDGFMKAISRLDDARGFVYDLRDSYIYHALEKPEDIDRVEAEIKRRGWGDPNFMHARQIPSVEMLHALGFKLKTYNLEDLDQMRLASSNMAEMRSSTLEGLHAAGLALSRFDMAKLEKDQPKVAAQVRQQVAPQVWRSPRAQGQGDPHQTYWVHKDSDFMLHRATDPVLWHPVIGAVVQGLNAIKQRTVGLNLGWSLYHQVHMLSIGSADSLALAYSKQLAGTATLADWSRAVEDALTLGAGSHVRSLTSNQKLLNWYLAKGTDTLKDLSPHEQQMFELQQGGGFVPLVSHERQIQISRMLLANRVGKTADAALNLGYDVLTAKPYQQWLFNRVIPSLKLYSYNRAAMALLEAHPEFRRPQYRLQRNIELRKIRDQVDDRYGEQNLRQSFTDPHIKYLGQSVLLSYSWLKSFIGVYGGGLHDMTRFIKDRPETPRATNRIAYMMTLSAVTAATNLLIAHFIGAGVKSLQDAFYPNIGPDDKGKLERVKPPFWITTEIAGFGHDVEASGGNPILGLGTFFANKMQPAISTIADLIANKDYYHADIAPPIDKNKDPVSNAIEQIWSRAEFALRQSSSFTLQAGLKPGAKPRDVILQLLGVPLAPAYATRSAMENRIIREYLEYDIPAGKRKDVEEQMNARRDYRQAVQDKDPGRQSTTRQKLTQLGITEKSIHNIEKTAGESEAERLFSQMKKEEQSGLWKDMSPEEQQEFGKFLHKDLKKTLLHAAQ
jgi:hypothetical protein